MGEAVFINIGEGEKAELGRDAAVEFLGSPSSRPGVVHAFGNAGTEPATFLEIYAPGGFEGFLRDLARTLPVDEPPDPAQLDALVRRHDVVYA